METPDRTTAEALLRYASGEVLADCAALNWPGIHVRIYQSPRVVDQYLVPATAEPLMSCVLAGAALWEEREPGGVWVARPLRRGDIFVTRSRTPYELRGITPAAEPVTFILVHLAIDQYLAALESAFPGRTDTVEVIDFFGRDETLAHTFYACAELLAARTPGQSRSVAAIVELFTAQLIEKYIDAAVARPDFRGGLPIRQLRKVEDHVSAHLAEPIAVEALAALVELSPFHFSRVFKQTTGMSPLAFVTRERIVRAQRLIRETRRSLIEIALEVGYTSPSHFAQVFRRTVGATPTEFRNAL